MSTPRPKTKPVPAPVAKQTARSKPIPAPVKPSTAAKKPVPGPVARTTSRPAGKPAPAARAPAKAAPKPAPQGKSTVQKIAAQAPKVPEGPKADNWINRTVQGYVAGAGNYAGGLVNGVGDSVNKVGEGIGQQISGITRYWGQGVAGYGNNLKDVVGAGGARVSTAGNPLGMAGVGSSQGMLPGGKKPGGNTRDAGRGSSGNPLGI